MQFNPARFHLGFVALLALAEATAISCDGMPTGVGAAGQGGDIGTGAGGRGGTGMGNRGDAGAGGRGSDMDGHAGGGGSRVGTGGSSSGGQTGGEDAGGSVSEDASTTDAAPDGGPVGPPPVAGDQFRHPGILVNQAQLAFIRDQVKAGVEPWKTAYDHAMSEFGSLTRNASPRAVVECGAYSNPNLGCSEEIQDASAAYALALAWNVTGNEAYAKKAIEVMNAWAHTLKSHTNHNAPLQSGWSGAIWPVAGEIIRHTYTGWAPADVGAFSDMLKNVYLPTVIKGSGGNGNWELVMTEATLEIAVFLDDHATFQHAVDMWRKRVPAYFYVTSDGANPAPPPTGGKDSAAAIKSFWFNIGMYVDGVAQETCRDFGHTEYGLASSIAVAETAFQQGLDLYKENGARLRAAMEFHAAYTLGKPAPSWLCGGKINTRLMPTFEIGYNHFHDRMGLDLPQSLKLIETRIRSIEAANKHMVWETLTHAGAGWVGLR